MVADDPDQTAPASTALVRWPVLECELTRLSSSGALGVPDRERPDSQAADDWDAHRGRLLASGGTQATARG
jgi:hypothetical protein